MNKIMIYLVDKWEHLSTTEQAIPVIILILIFFLFARLVKQRALKNKVERFLFNNGYCSTDPNTGEHLYPKVIFLRDRIIIKNCSRKTKQQVQDDRELWENEFYKKLKNRKIADIKIEQGKIIMVFL